jgi:hypothetical protein
VNTRREPALIVAAGVLYALIASPPMVTALESSMVGHMLIQLPLLALAGGLAARGLVGQRGWSAAGLNANGIAGLVVATFAAVVWMLPRALDGALTNVAVEAAKFITVPVLVGAALALSWPLAGVLVRGLIWAHIVAMQLALGWLYLATPVRLCVSYRLDQQSMLGAAMLMAAGIIAVALTVGAFVGPRVAITRCCASRALLPISRAPNGCAACESPRP